MNSIRDNPAAQAFAATAARYCALLESPVCDRELWLGELLTTLATIYAAAPVLLQLPLPEEDLDIPQTYRLGNEEWNSLFLHLRQTLGTDCLYYAYFKPAGIAPAGAPAAAPPPDAPVTGDLADDLADIYRDLKPGVTAWNTLDDRYLHDVLFQWVHMGFMHHWGRHAVNALRALHGLVYG